MVIAVNLHKRDVTLTEPDDFGRFSAVVVGAGSASALAEVVHRSRVGRLHPDGVHLVVDPVALRALAGESATDAWDEGLAGMCAYAAEKGWLEDDGGILAHIERRG